MSGETRQCYDLCGSSSLGMSLDPSVLPIREGLARITVLSGPEKGIFVGRLQTGVEIKCRFLAVRLSSRSDPVSARPAKFICRFHSLRVQQHVMGNACKSISYACEQSRIASQPSPSPRPCPSLEARQTWVVAREE